MIVKGGVPISLGRYPLIVMPFTLLNSGQVDIALELETANFSATGYTISTGQTAPIPL